MNALPFLLDTPAATAVIENVGDSNVVLRFFGRPDADRLPESPQPGDPGDEGSAGRRRIRPARTHLPCRSTSNPTPPGTTASSSSARHVPSPDRDGLRRLGRHRRRTPVVVRRDDAREGDADGVSRGCFAESVRGRSRCGRERLRACAAGAAERTAGVADALSDADTGGRRDQLRRLAFERPSSARRQSRACTRAMRCRSAMANWWRRTVASSAGCRRTPVWRKATTAWILTIPASAMMAAAAWWVGEQFL